MNNNNIYCYPKNKEISLEQAKNRYHNKEVTRDMQKNIIKAIKKDCKN